MVAVLTAVRAAGNVGLLGMYLAAVGVLFGGMRLTRVDESLATHADPMLEAVRDQARAAMVARKTVFTARLPMGSQSVGEVPEWLACIQQIEQNGWKLSDWTVCAEPGPVAYAVFRKS